MADYNINQLTGRLSRLFTGTAKRHYDYLVNRIQDSHEEQAFSEKRQVFYAKCISFYDTNNPSLDSIDKMTFDDKNINQYAVRFRFTGIDIARNQLPDPGLQAPGARRVLTIMHPYAIVDKKDVIMGVGSIFRVRELNGTYLVDSILDASEADKIRKQAAANAKDAFVGPPAPLGSFPSDPTRLQDIYINDNATSVIDITKKVNGQKNWGNAEQSPATQAAWNYLRPFLPPGTGLNSVIRTQANQDAVALSMAKNRGQSFTSAKPAYDFLIKNKVRIARKVGHGHGGKNGSAAFDLSGADINDIKKSIELFNDDPWMNQYVKFEPFMKGHTNRSILEPSNGVNGVAHIGLFLIKVKLPYDPTFLTKYGFFDSVVDEDKKDFMKNTDTNPEGWTWREWKQKYPAHYKSITGLDISPQNFTELKNQLKKEYKIDRTQ